MYSYNVLKFIKNITFLLTAENWIDNSNEIVKDFSLFVTSI